MITWADLKVREEYNKELLREAEQERLAQQVRAGGEGSTIWLKIKGLFSGSDQSEEVAEKAGAELLQPRCVAIKATSRK